MSESLQMSGATFRGIRKILCLTQGELAERLGVSPKTVWSYEQSACVPPMAEHSIRRLWEIAQGINA